MPPPHDLTLTDLRAAITARTVSAEEITRHALDRLHTLNPTLNAFLDTFPDHALARARAIDARLARGENPGPLAAIPIALKDNLCLGPDPETGHDGGRTTCASRFLEDYRSPYTATAAQRLLDAGAIIIGKANLDEFAMGSSGEHSAFGPTRNPWDHARVPGGSSSGSAAAVAARIVPAALGSDTGGSIRQPAGFCNLVGVKPTYARVSRYGLVAFASSLDQIGPLTRTIHDAATLLSILCAHDPRDATSVERPSEDFSRDLDTPIKDLRLGVPKQARSPANHPAVAATLDHAIRTYESLGATVIEVDLPHTPHAIAAYYIIASAEASSNLARFDGVRYGRRPPPPPLSSLPPGAPLDDLYARSRAEGFGPEVRRRIMLGTHVLSSGYYDAYYTTALKVRRLIKQDFDRAFGGDGTSVGTGCHALLLPTSPGPAFKIGEKSGGDRESGGSDSLALYLEDVYTVPANLAGLPALTLPAGFAQTPPSADATFQHLPIGLQLIVPPFQESCLLRVARMYEDATEFWKRRPSSLHP